MTKIIIDSIWWVKGARGERLTQEYGGTERREGGRSAIIRASVRGRLEGEDAQIEVDDVIEVGDIVNEVVLPGGGLHWTANFIRKFDLN